MLSKRQIDTSSKKIENPLTRKKTIQNFQEIQSKPIRDSNSIEILLMKEKPELNEKRKMKFEEIYAKNNKEALFSFFIEEINQIMKEKQEEAISLVKEFEAKSNDEATRTEILAREKVELEELNSMLKGQVKQLQAEVNNQNRQIKTLIHDLEEQTFKSGEIEEKMRDQFEKAEKGRKEIAERSSKEQNDLETRLREAVVSLELTSKERDDLAIKVKMLASVKTSNEQMTIQNESQIEELTRRFNALSEENERLKVRYQSTLRDKEKLTDQLKEKSALIDSMKREHQDALETLTMQHMAQLNARANKAKFASIKTDEIELSGALLTDSTARLINDANTDFNLMPLGDSHGSHEVALPHSGKSIEVNKTLPTPKKVENPELDRDGDIIHFLVCL